MRPTVSRPAAMTTGAAATAAVLAAALAGCSAGPIDVIDLDPRNLGTGLLAHWSFNDGAGTVLKDVSGNGRDGTVVNPSWIDGPPGFGGALRFAAGAASEVDVPSFPPARGSWSVAGWVRPPPGDTGDSYATIISTEMVLVGGWQLNLRLTPDNSGSAYQFAYWVGPGVSDYIFHDCSCVAVNQWTHIAGVVDTSTSKLLFYRDGVLDGQEPATQPIKEGSPTLYLARWATDGRVLIGDLDDFVIYNRALTPREIAGLARAPLPAPF